jgi:hypothetical protein
VVEVEAATVAAMLREEVTLLTAERVEGEYKEH